MGVLAELRDLGAEVRISIAGREFAGAIREVHVGGVVLQSGSIRRLIRLESIHSVRRSAGCSIDPARLDGEGAPDSPLGWSSMLGARLESDDDISVSTSTRTIEGRLLVTSRAVLQLRAIDGDVDYLAVDEVEVISLNVPGSIRHDSTNASTSSRITRITRPNR